MNNFWMNTIIHRLKSGNQTQLFCFPYLGGYANSFLNLAKNIHKDIEVWSMNAPGHGGSNAAPITDISSLVDLYFYAMRIVLNENGSYYLFGHSMGAIVAYFLFQKITNLAFNVKPPNAIILSACNSPSYFLNKRYSLMSDGELMHQLISYGALSQTIMHEKSLLEYFLPVYRADFMILESAAESDFKPLDIPVYYLLGDKDKIVTIDETMNWSKYFLQKINFITIKNGEHLFVNTKPRSVANMLEYIIQI